MWNAAAKLCAERLAADPPTKELRDLVYIAETLQDMKSKSEKAAADAVLVVFGDSALEEYGE